MKKLAIVVTHPIQYNSPWFKLLTEIGKVQLKVFYTWPQAIHGFDDPDFGHKVSWDIPLLEGYEYELVENVSNTPSSKAWSGIDCPALIPSIEKYSPNAILVIGWKLKSHFAVMRYFKGKIPVWFRGDSTLLDEIPGFKQKIRRIGLKMVYRYVDKAFYVGKASKAYFLAHGVAEGDLVYAPHAIDNERYATFRKERNGKEKNRNFKLVFCGKLELKKRPDLLVDAVQTYNKSNSEPIRLDIAGNGALERELLELVKDDENICMIGFQNQSQMPSVYGDADVFCLPSEGPGETWGLAVNEALASGTPVIVSDKVGCAQDIVNGKNGYVFKSGDLVDLIKGIKDLKKRQVNPKDCHESIQPWNFKRICEALENELNKTS